MDTISVVFSYLNYTIANAKATPQGIQGGSYTLYINLSGNVTGLMNIKK